MAEKFSLKDQLFNATKVTYLAGLMKAADDDFDDQKFTKQVLKKLPELELKQRITWIRQCLKEFLPKNYTTALAMLLRALPDENDPNKGDNDFGDFIFAPIADYVAVYGCNAKQLERSLSALKEITKRFSGEDSIRYFLNAFPEQTLAEITKWSKDENYHVRRLASEGTRPKLPWCQKVELDSQKVIKNILENLYYDPTRYVVRSVANHLNDISKDDPELVIKTLKRWQSTKKTK